MQENDHTDAEFAALDRKLRELENEPDEDGLYPECFMREFTDFTSWDQFKVRLAATPRPEREVFMQGVTRFASYEEMERVALERLTRRRSGTLGR